jgi:hypothetical protein
MDENAHFIGVTRAAQVPRQESAILGFYAFEM